MVFDRIDEDSWTSHVLQHSSHVSMERIANSVRNDLLAVFGAENKMEVKPGQRLRHGLCCTFRSGLLRLIKYA